MYLCDGSLGDGDWNSNELNQCHLVEILFCLHLCVLICRQVGNLLNQLYFPLCDATQLMAMELPPVVFLGSNQ